MVGGILTRAGDSTRHEWPANPKPSAERSCGASALRRMDAISRATARCRRERGISYRKKSVTRGHQRATGYFKSPDIES
jgi:hypothetical protein